MCAVRQSADVEREEKVGDLLLKAPPLVSSQECCCRLGKSAAGQRQSVAKDGVALDDCDYRENAMRCATVICCSPSANLIPRGMNTASLWRADAPRVRLLPVLAGRCLNADYFLAAEPYYGSSCKLRALGRWPSPLAHRGSVASSSFNSGTCFGPRFWVPPLSLLLAPERRRLLACVFFFATGMWVLLRVTCFAATAFTRAVYLLSGLSRRHSCSDPETTAEVCCRLSTGSDAAWPLLQDAAHRAGLFCAGVRSQLSSCLASGSPKALNPVMLISAPLTHHC